MIKKYIPFFFCIVVLATLYASFSNPLDIKETHREVTYISNTSLNFKELSDYFQKLSVEKGAVYAFEVLKKASFQGEIDLHLLGHVVGDELYKQKSIEGISDCTNDFRNACSHSIVVGTLLEHGEGAISRINEACQKAPGGKGAYTMCFHGLGHGILAFYNYELPPTIELCKKTGTKEYGNREYVECGGGAIMEMVGGGFHDKIAWEEGRKKYFTTDDPLSPCSSNFMPQETRSICYIYITPRLWEAVGADSGHPTSSDFAKAFPLCEKITTGKENKNACYEGFGKEFIGLANSRDIRLEALAQLDSKAFQKIYDWCSLTPYKEAGTLCLISTLNSLYWGGENKSDISINFCETVSTNDNTQGEACFNRLTENVSFYISNRNYKKNFCNTLPKEYQSSCFSRLLE